MARLKSMIPKMSVIKIVNANANSSRALPRSEKASLTLFIIVRQARPNLGSIDSILRHAFDPA
jgi:hypothetical protein